MPDPEEVAPEVTEEAAAPAPVTLFCVGGQRHGERIEVAPTATTWVDIMTATTYYVRPVHSIDRDPANPRSLLRAKGWRTAALVHESIAADAPTYHSHWTALALSRLMDEAGAIEVPVTELVGPAGQQSQPQG